MTPVTILCPQCSSSLKLPDRSMLGRKGKCPRCGHRFILLEPEEVQLELAEPEAPAPRSAAPQLMAGTSAMWVPDAPAEAESELPTFPLAESSPSNGGRRPRSAPSQGQPADSSTEETSGGQDRRPSDAAVPDPAVFAELTAIPPATTAAGRIPRRRKRRSASMTMIIGICSAVVAGTIGGIVLLRDAGNSDTGSSRAAPAVNPEWQQRQADDASANEVAVALSPTDGEPITLQYVPFTPSLVFHLRPADIWGRDNQMREFRATLGNLGIWLEEQIVAVTTFEPAEISELTFAVVFGPRTTAPEVYTVFRTVDEQTPDAYRRFNGRLRKDLDEDVYEADVYSYMMIDRRTFSAAPTSVSDALAAAKTYSAIAPPELDPLLRESDRQRHMTLMFDLKTIDVHREFVLMEQLQVLADQFVVWMGKDVHAISWSLHLQPDCFMETLLRQTNESSPLRIQRALKDRLSDLPANIAQNVRLMQPQTEGVRQIIGRFPAMLKGLQLGTSFHATGQFARLTTLLPAKAAPNLAAGSLLTWNQAQLTDLSQLTTATPGNASQIPDKVSDRLKMPVLVDFRNFPLQEAVAYIGEEIKTEFLIDGDALKGAGFTQNMSQTYALGTVPALTALDTILAKYAGERDPMVIVVDETAKRITLTTQAGAAAKGQTVFPTK